ncbi:helix-turn-helix domain-containing protein [Actinoplanes ianthinogenes]|uniref:helix-turn-helix domain-containing protein n=1 Tax=Actinoplanes ianthinogenes TaxID=122358 RepID=UPI0034D4E3EF
MLPRSQPATEQRRVPGHSSPVRPSRFPTRASVQGVADRLRAGVSQAVIGAGLDRSPSTISREIRRNRDAPAAATSPARRSPRTPEARNRRPTLLCAPWCRTCSTADQPPAAPPASRAK